MQSNKLICAPFYPQSGQVIIRRLTSALKATENPSGPGLDQKQVADLIGIPSSTLNDWLHDDQVTPIKRFLLGLERLPDDGRINLLRSLCRNCPRLEDPRISHDKHAVAAIESLIQRPGITLITGPSDQARTYLITAIGNSFATRLKISGFDVHPPVHFVPVPGVCYPTTNVIAEAMPSLFSQVWPDLPRSEVSMIILNGIWNRIHAHHKALLKLAPKKHLLIADDCLPATFARRSGQRNVIYAESVAGNPGAPQFRIRVEIG